MRAQMGPKNPRKYIINSPLRCLAPCLKLQSANTHIGKLYRTMPFKSSCCPLAFHMDTPLCMCLKSLVMGSAPLGPAKKLRTNYHPGQYYVEKNSNFLGYLWDFLSNIKVFGQNNLIFELLRQKWCRIIMSFRQKPIFGPETCQIGLKLWLQSCPDLLLTP